MLHCECTTCPPVRSSTFGLGPLNQPKREEWVTVCDPRLVHHICIEDGRTVAWAVPPMVTRVPVRATFVLHITPTTTMRRIDRTDRAKSPQAVVDHAHSDPLVRTARPRVHLAPDEKRRKQKTQENPKKNNCQKLGHTHAPHTKDRQRPARLSCEAVARNGKTTRRNNLHCSPFQGCVSASCCHSSTAASFSQYLAMLISRCASLAFHSLPAWRATRAAQFLKSRAWGISVPRMNSPLDNEVGRAPAFAMPLKDC